MIPVLLIYRVFVSVYFSSSYFLFQLTLFYSPGSLQDVVSLVKSLSPLENQNNLYICKIWFVSFFVFFSNFHSQTSLKPSVLICVFPRYRSLNLNQFSGTIPASIGRLSKLYWFDIADNQIEGTLPVSNGTSLPGLDMLLETKHLYI